jgi:hypothetical protein
MDLGEFLVGKEELKRGDFDVAERQDLRRGALRV